MIIRRRHTANFTTIGNVLFEDDRLAADELGILAFLLSRPNDWEVRRPALARRFGLGRDAIKRVIFNCMALGWIGAQRTRLTNGTYYTIYEVRDQPGPELTPEQVRSALSLVSSEAKSDGEDVDDQAAEHPPDTGPPSTAQPHAGQPATANPSWPIRDSLKTDSPRTESTKAARAFVDVREQWPNDHVLSLVVCEALHAGLIDADKERAFKGTRPYLDDCRAQNRKICDLATFYRERRWELFVNKATRPALFIVRRGTAQAMRWREHFKSREPMKLQIFDETMNSRGEYTTLSEWPPSKEAIEARVSEFAKGTG